MIFQDDIFLYIYQIKNCTFINNSKYVSHEEHFKKWKHLNVTINNDIVNIQIVSCNYLGDIYFDNITNENYMKQYPREDTNYNFNEQKEIDDYYDYFFIIII